jgi:hypothetical protein
MQFLLPLVTSFLGSNVLLSTLLSYTLNLCFFLSVRDAIPLPYNVFITVPYMPNGFHARLYALFKESIRKPMLVKAVQWKNQLYKTDGTFFPSTYLQWPYDLIYARMGHLNIGSAGFEFRSWHECMPEFVYAILCMYWPWGGHSSIHGVLLKVYH